MRYERIVWSYEKRRTPLNSSDLFRLSTKHRAMAMTPSKAKYVTLTFAYCVRVKVWGVTILEVLEVLEGGAETLCRISISSVSGKVS